MNNERDEQWVKPKIKLKPCPFCGCKIHMEAVEMCDGKTLRFFPVGHHKRGCQLEYASFVGNPTTFRVAAQKWNRRANDE
ncbi:MAG: hypothetical protein HDT42_06210 [Ruminococcaceae bacterium]|nr:hypothetical protein [Oscillospiraceae bacterium]